VTDRHSDGQTDGQTKFSSLYCFCITWSAVKTIIILWFTLKYLL